MFQFMSDLLETPSLTDRFPDPFVDADADLDATEPAEDDNDGGDGGGDADDPQAGRAARRPVPQRAVQAAQRKAVAKTIQVMAANKKTRAATAALLGVQNADDVAAVTMACLSAGKAALRPVRDVLEVAGMDNPFAMMGAAIALADSDARFKAAWDALDTVASVGRQPGNAAKAGMAFAQAVAALTDAQKEELRLPEELIG